MAGKRKAEEPLAAGLSSKKQMTLNTRAYRKDPRRATALKKACVAVAGAWKPAMVELLDRAEAIFTSAPEVAALLAELEDRYDRTIEENLAHHERVARMKRDELFRQSEAALAAVHDEFRDRTRRAEEEMIAHERVSIMKRFRRKHRMLLPAGADRHLTTLPNDPDIIKVQALVNLTSRSRPRFYQEAETIWDDWRACTETARLGPQPAPLPLPRSFREIMAAQAAEGKEEKQKAAVAAAACERDKMIRRAGNKKGYVQSRKRRPKECRWQGAPPSWREKRNAEKKVEMDKVETNGVRKTGRKGKRQMGLKGGGRGVIRGIVCAEDGKKKTQ